MNQEKAQEQFNENISPGASRWSARGFIRNSRWTNPFRQL